MGGSSCTARFIYISSCQLLVLKISEFFMQELIKNQVANMYLWPKTLEVPILDPSKYVCPEIENSSTSYDLI